MSEPFAYDAVEYPSAGIPQMHPGHLFAVARMFGCAPAPPQRCRYLEFGCGDGVHLIGCAMGLPDATFVGVDLSAVAIERGNRLIAQLGVNNVSLHVADVTVWTPPVGEFDFACAHGLYSWVPPVVRDAVLTGMHSALVPNGIGFVSYNTYPGCYVRRMVWEMMQQHTVNTVEPAAKLREATDLLRFLLAGQPVAQKPAVAAVAHEMTQLLVEGHSGSMYHDDLGAINDPCYVRQFVEHTRLHGLRFVAEAEPVMMNPDAYPPAVAGVLRGMAAQDVILKEQYIDFLRVRRFRQTLLAKDSRSPLAHPDPVGVRALLVSGDLTVEGDVSDLCTPAEVTFRRNTSSVTTPVPLVKAALLTLAEGGPRRVPFAELLTTTTRRLGRTEPKAVDDTQLREALTEAWMGGMIDLHGHCPWYFDRVSERPVVCPLARARVPVADVVNSRLFTPMNSSDPAVRRLLPLIDGTRTADEIAAEWTAHEPLDQRPALRVRLENYLLQMARNGLLVG